MSVQRLTVKPDTEGIRIVFRRGSSEEWISENPILSDGEPAINTTNMTLKIGDGVTPWSDLGESGLVALIRMMLEE